MAGDVVRTQVAVVGAGPVGLLLAAELRLGGAQTLVMERLARPTNESRASTVHARTMEIFRMRGLLAQLGTIPHDNAGHFGGIPLDFGGLATRYPGQWKLAQAKVEELLAKRVVDLGGTILREHEVRDVRDLGDHVELSVACPGGPVRVLAEYVVGCDGEQSTVATTAGFERAGTAATRTMLRCDVAGIEIPNRRFHRLPGGLAVAGTLPSGVTRVMVHEFGRPPLSGTPTFADVVAAWARVTGEDISAGTPLWVNAFGDESRQAQHYRRGRVLLAGDAAHVQMPAGGQALNLGLHDAVNLGWKLAAQVRGRAPDGLLDSYHDERHPVGARVLANIRAQGLILLGGPEVDAFRDLLAELIAGRAVTDHLTGMISGLDVRYGGTGHPLVGTRVPVDDIGLAGAVLETGKGVLLGLLSGRLAAGARPWADRVSTVRSVAPPALPTLPGLAVDDALLVRPDGHAAWIGNDRRSLRTALYQWFGPPS